MIDGIFKCSDFDDIEDCANDDFCRVNCHFVACQELQAPISSPYFSYYLLDKEAPDTQANGNCTAGMVQVRFDLAIGDSKAVPALSIFVLTIFSGLLAMFVILVLHYNCMLSLKGHIPYRLPWMKFCHKVLACEMFFPICVDEEQIKNLLLNQEANGHNLPVFDGQSTGAGQQNGQTAMLLPEGYHIDFRTIGSEAEVNETSYEEDQTPKGMKRGVSEYSDFVLDDDEIMQELRRNKKV